MAKIGTRSKKESGVLAHEYAPEFGYCRDTATVTIQAGMDVGAVVQLVANKWVWVANADVATLATSVGVLIDGEKDIPSLTVGDQSLVVLTRGPSAVVDIGMLYKDAVSAPNQVLVQTALKKLGILTRTGV